MKKFNKGEWAEFYVLIKLLADGKIYYGDEEMRIIDDQYFEIDKILKSTQLGDQIFYIHKEFVTTDDIKVFRQDLYSSALKIFDKIIEGDKTFEITEANTLQNLLKIEQFSQGSNQKADIKLSLFDNQSHTSSIYGFSIKTKLSAKSTLVNSSGKSTGFRYQIHNCNDKIMNMINETEGVGKINQRIANVLNSGCEIKFVETTSDIYRDNLKMIDTVFDSILAELLLSGYIYNKKILHQTIQTSRFVEFYNLLGLTEDAIVYKIKNFLNVSAIGMTPAKNWDGNIQVDGGIIVVKKNGEIVGYFVFDLEKFKQYLWNNTYFETPSTTRHNFGYVYKIEDNYFFDLNLQVRFT
jgi:hypothetical protein